MCEEIERVTPRTLVWDQGSFGGLSSKLLMSLSFPEQDIAAFLPNKGCLTAVCIVLVIFGVASWLFGGYVSYELYGFRSGFGGVSILPLVFFGVEGLAILVLGLAGLMGKCDDGRVVLDRRRGLIVKRARKHDRVAADALRINNVAAVQLCSGIIDGTEALEEGDAAELNLVFKKPAGGRICLARYGKATAARSDAEQLAEFLSVPMWEHLSERSHVGRVRRI